MSVHIRRRPARAWRAPFVALALCGAGVAPARGQEPDPTPPAEDEEIRRLRQAAQEALDEEAGPAPADEGERLRRAALAEAEESPLQQQLLAAYYSVANRLNTFNPRITVFGDVIGRLSASSAELVEDGRNVDDRVSLAEAEIDLRADIDPYAKGVLILAFEEVGGGEYEAKVEEGYLTLETLPLGFHAQIGRFRVPFGRVNRLHRHDLPQTTRPYPLVDVFGEEGLIENGAILSWLAPLFPLELTAAFMNGENERLLAGTDSDDPSWLGRAEVFFQLGDQTFLSLGHSYLFGYNDAPAPVDLPGRPSQETHLWGADALFKYQWNQFQSLVVQGEVFSLRREVAGGREHAFGGYALVQVQPLQRWYLGLRYDWSNYDEGREDAEQWAIGGWVSFYTTEFLRFRIGYEHRERTQDADLDTVYFQITFVFGSHPVEPFWFNR